MKLWDKGNKSEKSVEHFTTSSDRCIDIRLAPYDVLGSIAHAKMLKNIGVLSASELTKLENALSNLYRQIKSGDFIIDEGIEDVHSQVEFMLTNELGGIGKKIHSGRSRNDQVLLDLRLFFRDFLEKIIGKTHNLFETLIKLSDKHKNDFMPGYTHMQLAMPSSFGLWFGAYSESLVDDMQTLLAAYKINNQNPLGSAAGYGTSFPLNRSLTTRLLGFEELQVNAAYSQISRLKNEKTIAFGLASVANTLAKIAMDICLFSGQNFNFFVLPEQFTTGSSIMPHKNNPDPFELIRAKCNKLNCLPNEINFMSTNLNSGYHRDYQLTKQSIIPAFDELDECISMTNLLINNLKVNISLKEDPKYDNIFSVEEVNKLVMKGVPFRDAYKQVAAEIKAGNYKPDKEINHSHEGSIGNLCNDMINNKMEKLLAGFDFKGSREALQSLLSS